MTILPALSGLNEAPQRWRGGARALFGVGYAIAATVTALCVWLAASAPASGPVTVASRNVLTLLGFNLLLIGVLAFAVGLTVLKLLRSGARDAGARLHLRFASLFAFAAVAPAVIVALFFGLIVTRGVDSWFSSRVRTVVENHAGVANLLLQSQTEPLESAVAATAVDLGRYAPDLARQFRPLRRFAHAAGGGAGLPLTAHPRPERRILSQSVGSGARFAPPEREDFELADARGSSFQTYEREDLVRVLFPLRGAGDAYVYLSAPLPPGMLNQLRDSEQAVVAYREAEANRERVQVVFGLVTPRPPCLS
jgi:two-component system nitrogen regulation sensor histidine kinase NtrY